MDQSLRTHHAWKYVGIGVATIVLGALIAIAFIDEPLRGFIERRVNQRLDGYRLTIGSLDFHPIGFSIDLENVVLVKTQHPDQPILKLPFWTRECALARLAARRAGQRSPIRTTGAADHAGAGRGGSR